MRDEEKTREDLLRDVEELRGRVMQLAAAETERRRAVVALRRSERTARALLDATMDAAVLIHPDGTILALNEVAARSLGSAIEEAVGADLFELIPSELAEERSSRAREAARSGKPVRFVDASSSVYMENSIVPVFDAKGRVDRLAIFSRNISRQVQAEIDLRRAKEAAVSGDLAKSEFLANMSHELRTPLNAINGFSEVLEDQTFGPLNTRQLRYVKHIGASGRHLLQLINDILDLAKVESGKMELHRSEVEFRCLLENCLVMIREKAVQHKIELNLRIEDDLDTARVMLDEIKVKQVVFNLLSNAAKFTPSGGRIEVGASRSEEWIVIHVTDTGIGLNPQDQERIFRAFEQVDTSYTRGQQGTGLGLALSSRLVVLHGGLISVQSDGEGRGSTFKFTIPFVEPPSPDGMREEGSVSPADLGSRDEVHL
jgi:PAS domain S-box-containing protein